MRSQLYCTATSKTCVSKVDAIQNQVARYILQLPRSASCVCGYVDAGFKPIQAQAEARCMLFTCKVMNGRKSHMLRQVMESVLLDLQDPWTVQELNLCGAGGIGFLNKRLLSVRRSLTNTAVASVLSLMRDHTSLLCMPQPDVGLNFNLMLMTLPYVGFLADSELVM